MSLMTDEELMMFKDGFAKTVNAIADTLEKNYPTKIQNLILLEIIGHSVLTIQKASRQEGDPEFRFGIETMLVEYMKFLIATIVNDGKFPEPEQKVN